MYIGFLHLHDTLRWLLLLFLVIALIKYMFGWVRHQPWKKTDHVLGIVITWLMDLQLIIGLVLYFFLSPLTKMAFSNFASAMKEPTLRFYAVEHITIMVIAVVIVHIGREITKKAQSDLIKFRTSSIFFLVSLVLLMIAIPWSRL